MSIFYTLEEAAGLLGMSPAVLRGKAQSGEVRGVLVGGTWKLRKNEVHDVARKMGFFATEVIDVSTEAQIETPAEAASAVTVAPMDLAPSSPSIPSSEALRDAFVMFQEFARQQGLWPGAGVPTMTSPPPVAPTAVAPETAPSEIEPEEGGTFHHQWDALLEAALVPLEDEIPAPVKAPPPPKKDLVEPAQRMDEPEPWIAPGETAAALEPEPPALIEPTPKKPTAEFRPVGLPIECPNPDCREFGQIPFNRINQQLRCAHCQTQFYIDATTNEVILGKISRPGETPAPAVTQEKPKASTAETTAPAPAPVLAAPRRDSVIAASRRDVVKAKGLEERFEHIVAMSAREKVRLVAPWVVAIAVLALIYTNWPRIPNTTRARTDAIVAALAGNSSRGVRSLATTASVDSVDGWFEMARPANWKSSEPIPQYFVSVMRTFKEGNDSARSQTLVNFPPNVAQAPQGDETAERAAAELAGSTLARKKSAEPDAPKGLTLRLYWERTGKDGPWLFDAKQSLVFLTSSRKGSSTLAPAK